MLLSTHFRINLLWWVWANAHKRNNGEGSSLSLINVTCPYSLFDGLNDFRLSVYWNLENYVENWRLNKKRCFHLSPLKTPLFRNMRYAVTLIDILDIIWITPLHNIDINDPCRHLFSRTHSQVLQTWQLWTTSLPGKTRFGDSMLSSTISVINLVHFGEG